MNTSPQSVFRFLVGVAIAAAVCFLVWYFSSVVVYVLVSAVLAIMCRPLVRRLTELKIRDWSMPRWVAAFMALVTIWVVFITLFMLLIPLVSNKLSQLSTVDFSAVLSVIEEPILDLQDQLQRFLPNPREEFSLNEALVDTLRRIVDIKTINSAFSSVVGLLLSSVVAFFSISFITFFFMKEDGLFFTIVQSMFPERYQENVNRAMESITKLLSRYFSGLLVESGALMLTVSLVMILFGMQAQDAFFIGLIMGVMNVVPYAGPLIGGITSVFLGMISPIEGMTVGYTVTVIACSLLVIKGFDDFVLQPTIYSERVNAHPLEVFLVILIAGSLAGILGMLLAIPAYTVLRVFAKEFFSQVSLVKKLTQQI
ncbi:MAG: AI-2E family transporter [Alistipes sp.]|nr:AI-2E family transporter [Alistipes sp.]